jgi:hypothetical protein
VVTLMGIIQASLCIVAVATVGVLYPIADYQLRRYLRGTHPQVWRRFEFPSDSFHVPPQLERETVIANVGFGEFFSSGQYKTLTDPRLNVLWQRKRRLRWIGGLAMALMVVNFLVFRTAPDFSWIIG